MGGRYRRPKRPTCQKTGKAIFKDEIAAKIELARITKRDDEKRPKIPQRYYECEHANHYHLTAKQKYTPERNKSDATGKHQSPEEIHPHPSPGTVARITRARLRSESPQEDAEE